ncbi:hypothetical protein BH20ACI3_BH20ACI3_30300 [soil metagenome]
MTKRKKGKTDADDDLRSEYDLSKLKFVGRGIYAERFRSGTNLALLDRDVREFDFEIPILQAPLVAPKMDENADDPDLCEYLVRVEWIKAVPRTEAYWERGLFALQHTACRMTSSFTIERLSLHFGLDD